MRGVAVGPKAALRTLSAKKGKKIATIKGELFNSDGEIVSVTVGNGGTGYTTADVSVDVPKDNSNNDITGKVGSINIFNRIKRSYRVPPVISIAAPTAVDSDGNLLSSNVQATANFVMESTSLEIVKMISGGSGYTSIPTVTISGSATGRAIVQNGKVTGIEVLNKGSGYTTTPTITMAKYPTRDIAFAEFPAIWGGKPRITPIMPRIGIDSIIANCLLAFERTSK